MRVRGGARVDGGRAQDLHDISEGCWGKGQKQLAKSEISGSAKLQSDFGYQGKFPKKSFVHIIVKISEL